MHAEFQRDHNHLLNFTAWQDPFKLSLFAASSSHLCLRHAQTGATFTNPRVLSVKPKRDMYLPTLSPTAKACAVKKPKQTR